MILAKHEQPLENALAGTGVESGDNQMTRERRTDGDIGRLLIPNLSNDEHLRILPQEMAGGFGKVQTTGFVNLRLHDAWDDLFGGDTP